MDQQPSTESQSWPPTDLYCPRCAYPLKHITDAGLSQCPECGLAPDFDELRELRVYGQSLGSRWELWRKIIWRPGRFFQSLMAPRYYVRLPWHQASGLHYTGVSLAAVFGFCLFAALLLMRDWRALAFWFLLVFPLAILAANHTSYLWIRWLLKRSGHEQPAEGSQRVKFFASTVYVLMAAALCACILLGAAAVAFGLRVLLVLALLVAGLAPFLWLYWAWVGMRAYEAETRGLDALAPLWAFLNPGLASALLVTLVLLLLLLIP